MVIEDLLDKIDTGTSASKQDRSNRGKATVACVIAGLVVGLMVGYSKKWNLFYAAAGGAMIGGVAGAIFTPGSDK